MLIPFRRLGSQPLDFEANCDNAHFSGHLILKKSNLAELNGTITGSISVPCDICAEAVELPLDEEVSFYVSDGIFNGSEDLDVVETEKSVIDIDELLRSELELIKSDYHSCPDCEGKSLEREF